MTCMLKLECLVALCRTLLHPQLNRKKYAWKKMWKEKIFSENKSCLKLPELPRNHVSRGKGVLPQTPDKWHHRVTSRVAPCEQKGATKTQIRFKLEWLYVHTCMDPCVVVPHTPHVYVWLLFIGYQWSQAKLLSCVCLSWVCSTFTSVYLSVCLGVGKQYAYSSQLSWNDCNVSTTPLAPPRTPLVNVWLCWEISWRSLKITLQ